MTAKEYLQQLHEIDVRINQRIQQKAELRERVFGIGSPDCSKDRVQTSAAGGAGYERDIARIVDLETEIDRMIDGYADLKHKIIGEIQALKNSKYIEILYKRYVEGKRLEAVAVEMGYAFQYTVQLHGHALKEFSEKHSI